MATVGKSISQLEEASSVNPADILPVVQGGETKFTSKETLLQDYYSSAQVDALNLGFERVSQKGVPGGYVPLGAGGKVASQYIPAIALTEVYVVADEAARDALEVQEGDFAVVTGNGATYVYSGTDWIVAATSPAVNSVNGQIGTVVLNTGDVSEGSNLYYTDTRVATYLSSNNFLQAGGPVSALTNDAGYLTSYSETDPVFSASPAAGITAPSIASWNAKVSSQWVTSGSNIYYNTGAVGIGAAVPLAQLHVNSVADNSNNGLLQLSSTATGGTWLHLNNSSVGGASHRIWSSGSSNSMGGGSLVFSQGLSHRMIISNSGNVGIGAVAPFFKLDVLQTSNTYGIRTTDGTVETGMGIVDGLSGLVGTRSNHPLSIRTNNLTRVTVDTSGSVGVGTGAPSTLLHVYGTGSTGLTVERSSAANTSMLFKNTVSSFYAGLSTNANFAIGAAADLTAASFNITQSGNVGIWTTAPNRPLEVVGIIRSSNNFGGAEYLQNDGNGYRFVLNNDNTFRLQSTANSFGNASNILTVSSGNSVFSGALTAGVGTFTSLVSPTLTTAGTLTLSATGANSVVLSTNGVPRMQVDGTGKIGIGVAPNSRSLNIANDMSITGPTPVLYLNDTDYGGGRPGIRFTNNDLFTFAGDDTGVEANFNFYSTFSPTRNNNARFRVFGSAASSWGTYLEFTHTGASGSGQITTDIGDLVFRPANSERLRLTAAGNAGFGTATPTARVDISSDILRLRTPKTLASAGAAGNQGDICWDDSYVYVCVATNSWKRAALAVW